MPDRPSRPLTAYELDTLMQREKARKEGRDPDKRCLELDPSRLPCSKVKGHSGPHYMYRP